MSGLQMKALSEAETGIRVIKDKEEIKQDGTDN